MKIGHPADKLPPSAVTNGHASATGAAHAAQARSASSATAPATTPDDSAKIELSSTASTLLTTQASPEFDAQKVASISQAIADGSYKVNPEAIADKLIANAQELLTKVQP